MQEKQAAERLAAKIKRLEERNIKIPSADVLKSNPYFTNYRSNTSNAQKLYTQQIEGEQEFDEDDEVHDPQTEEKGTGVFYTVYD